MRVEGWRAWYTKGRTFESTSIKWDDLPDAGVLFVMLYMNETTVGGRRYREALYGCDHYWQEGRAYKNEDVSRLPGMKVGALLPDADFEAIVATAFASEW